MTESSSASTNGGDASGKHAESVRHPGGGTDGTQRLMNWSTIAAVAGLLLSAATLGFTVWFNQLLRLQAELMAPAARMAAEMDSDLSRTVAALRGYVAYGDPRFIRERREIWRQIEARYDEFRQIAEPQLPDGHQRSFEVFRAKLSELRHVQWAIEDVAHTPGNEPASQAYNDHVFAIRQSIHRAFRQGTDGARAEQAYEPDLFYQLAVFHALFMMSDAALQEYVRDPTAVNLQAYDLAARQFRVISDAIAHRLETTDNPRAQAMHGLARFVTTEAGAYRQRADDLTWDRRHREGTVAQSLFRHRALPLANMVSQRMRYISTIQAEAVSETAHLFRVLSIAIIAGALLIGVMSASTLYVSFRIRSRVDRALDRARKLGQYAVEKKLGAGGMGEVYLASHAMLRRPAAIKLLRGENQATQRAKKRFRTEVQLTSRLSHPNTVSIFDYGVTPDGTFYYAMEYLSGATLQQIVEATGPMPAERVIHVLTQVAGSLQEAHERGLLHRDVKPANIMLCELGGILDTVKVLDFGLVREVSDGSAGTNEGDARLEGTPLYIAPESVLDPASVDARSDLYAVGAVGYFLLVGSPPFEGDDVIDLLSKHVSDSPIPPSTRTAVPVHSDLERLILECLEKDPERRPKSARELRRRLLAIEHSQWTEARCSQWWSEFGEILANRTGSGADASSSALAGVAVQVASRNTRSSRSRS